MAADTWRPVLAGLGGWAPLANASAPVPGPVEWVGPIAVIAAGGLAGALAGRLRGGDWRRRRRVGRRLGALVGAGTAAVTFAAMAGRIDPVRHSPVWQLLYGVALLAGRVIPTGIAARFDVVLAAGVSLLVGTLTAVAAPIGAVLVSVERDPGPAECG